MFSKLLEIQLRKKVSSKRNFDKNEVNAKSQAKSLNLLGLEMFEFLVKNILLI